MFWKNQSSTNSGISAGAHFLPFSRLPLAFSSGVLLYFSSVSVYITFYLLLMEGGEKKWRTPIKIPRVRLTTSIARM